MKMLRIHATKALIALTLLALIAPTFAREQAPAAPSAAKPATPSAAPRLALQTNLGTLVVQLNADKAPHSVANFLRYAKDGFYNGTVFHRVINGFMIQGGGYTADMKQKSTRAPIQNEAKNGLKNVSGSIAMARTNDPHSATAQFFINVADNPFLDYPGQDGWGYAVFGQVISGMEVVRKIAQTPTGRSGYMQDVPSTPVIIESIKELP